MLDADNVGGEMQKERTSNEKRLINKNNRLYTLNLNPGVQAYGEDLRQFYKGEYRSFTPKRSKLAAVLKLGLPAQHILSRKNILYLGAATGTTVSHVSDMLPTGKIYSVEVAPRSFRSLLELAQMRQNIIPLLKDASKPNSYRYFVSNIDMIYQDISQRNQVEIFVKNADMFLPRGEMGYLMLKAHCIDSARPSSETFDSVHQQLKTQRFIIEEKIDLHPYQKDHICFVVKKNW